jgi:4-hydroxy-tetrahydrodipicolinate reductase
MIRIALLGYGKMGKLIERLAKEQGDEIVVILDEHNNAHASGIRKEAFANVDVAIDFSSAGCVEENVVALAMHGVNTVIGTTGWSGRLTHIREAVESSGTGLVWSPNFSIGVNVFTRAVREVAAMLHSQTAYEAWAYEIHHSAKTDAPSGTLLKLVDEMRAAGYERNIDVASNRAGSHPGTHVIGFDSAADTIELKHSARNRDGFAQGALIAAHWIVGKTGFHEFEDVIWK